MVTFEEFVAGQAAGLLRLAYLLTGDRHLAEDLLQTAMVKVYRRWRSVERAVQPEAYVRRILVNTSITWRRRHVWLERPTATGSLPDGGLGAGPDGDPAEELASREAVWQLLLRLPPRARAVLVLRFFEDLDDATIAQVLGVAPSTVRSTASRALAGLRAELTTMATGGVR